MGSVQQCSNPGASCPAAGYQCVFSSVLSQYICCGSGSTTVPAVCADGRQTFTQTSGKDIHLRLGNQFQARLTPAIPSKCPPTVLSDTTVHNQHKSESVSAVSPIRVPSGHFKDNPLLATTITPPSNFLQCPSGWNPFRNSLNQQVQYCASTTDQR